MKMDQSESGVIVVGAGLGGLATALASATRGLRVTVLEKNDMVGGAAAYSGGQVWIPANHTELAEGIEDSLEEGVSYVRAAARELPELLDEESMQTWLSTAPVAAKFFEDLGAVRWEIIPDYPDYYQDLPGAKLKGRYITATFESTKLGEWRDRFLVSPHFPVGVTYAQMFAQGAQESKGAGKSESERAVLVNALGGNLADTAAAPKAMPDLLTFGPGVVAGFLARAAQEPQIDIRTGQRVTALVREGDRVIGVQAEQPDGSVIEFRGTVVLATSGFDWDPVLVKEYLGLDASDAGALSPKTVTGDGLRIARAIGADVFRIPAKYYPLAISVRADDDVDYTSSREYALPHTFCVDTTAKRFADDGINWGITHAALDPDHLRPTMYMVWDSQHHKKYGLGAVAPGETYPDGLTKSAPTLKELGDLLGIDGDELERTAERFNAHAVEGADPDFGRGTVLTWNKFTGDPNHKPNPNVGPVVEPPFYAARLRPVTAGICLTGIHVDAQARVLSTSGSTIPGLFAVGSCAAFTTSGTGYNSGFALSRAITHAYLVATQLA